VTKTIAYINGMGNVSPQKTTTPGFLTEPEIPVSRQMKVVDPGYKDFIPADQIRRMSRIIRMGIASAKICLQDAGCTMPGAILTGTGLGCLEDTEKFITNLIRNHEEFLTPTSFIQSTHNTVSGQIALMLKCHGFNFTYVHRGFSFESALLDSLVQLASGHFDTVLTGGMDEITAGSFAILDRMGWWKRNPLPFPQIYSDPLRGTVAGEGSAFFLIGTTKNEHTYAAVHAPEMIPDPAPAGDLAARIHGFLRREEADPGLILLGLTGDPSTDKELREAAAAAYPGKAIGAFKHLCGEYFTSSAFGVWLGALILKTGTVPANILLEGTPEKLHQVMVHNHSRGTGHSLILLDRV
jgi:3-oxoacyl-(acyl-carrier-protein) synthase